MKDESKRLCVGSRSAPTYGGFAAPVVGPHGGPYRAKAVDHQAHKRAPQTGIDMVSPDFLVSPDFQQDEHFLTVCRYVERNALSAGLVERAESWRWGSLWARTQRDERLGELLSPWPVDRPRGWSRTVNRAISAREVETVQTCITRNRPLGSDTWQRQTVDQLGLMHTLRPEGRPKKIEN